MTSPIPSEPRTGQQLYHGGAIAPVSTVGPIASSEAWRLLAMGIGAIYGIQIAFAMVGVAGVVASAVSDVGCLAFFWWYARKRRLGAAGLGFTKAHAQWYGAAVLLGCSAWYVNMTIIDALHIPDVSKEMTKLLEGLLLETPLVSTIAAIAVLPAVAEEIVFRGALARGLGRDRPAWMAVVISSAVFGIYHLIPAQVCATFLLGCILGFLTLRSRSIVPAIVVHFLNNTIAIIVSRESVPGATAWIGAHPAVMLATAITVLLAGIALAVTAPRPADLEGAPA
jgi:membrane protease YdiL (CAAX protease family)